VDQKIGQDGQKSRITISTASLATVVNETIAGLERIQELEKSSRITDPLP
jgi:hypothetical protein